MCAMDLAFRRKKDFENWLTHFNTIAHKPLLGPNWNTSPYNLKLKGDKKYLFETISGPVVRFDADVNISTSESKSFDGNAKNVVAVYSDKKSLTNSAACLHHFSPGMSI